MGDFAEDCYRRDEVDQHHGCANHNCYFAPWLQQKRRAERAERERDVARTEKREWRRRLREAFRERDELLASNRRRREALERIKAGVSAGAPERLDCGGIQKLVDEALSADADADAETSCDCEPIRHGVGDEHQPDCAVRRDAEPERCGAQDPYGVAGPCHESAGHSGWHCAGPIRYKQRVAEGGRPREADPQGSGTPTRTGDASVDGGGDDGRSRAIEAATEAICYRPAAEDIIDRALASGGVVTAERADEAYRQGREHESYDWHATQDRVRELERECLTLAQRLFVKDDTLTHEERERLLSLKLWLRGDDDA